MFMNRDGLKKIYLIKSAGYEFVEIDIADNTLLLGESGVGKTTLMRAVLFFYTMDYSDSVLNLTSETKKSFNDWYFKEHNSHIIYEYTKEESRYLFVVSKTSKLHYTFIDITNEELGVRDIFIQNNKPVNFEKLNETIQKKSLSSYSTTIKERYINVFHKRDEFGKKIKTDTSIDFALFEDLKSRKEFARTLSNIFASSSIKSSNIKRTIVSLIDNATAKIALYDIKMNLSKFSKEKREIEKFEKKIPIIEELAKEYKHYQENKKEFKVLANKVEYVYKHARFQIQETDLKLEEKREEKKRAKIEYEQEKGVLESEKASHKTAMDIARSKLDELREKERSFQKNNITYLVSEFQKEKSYRENKRSLAQRYEALTSDVQSIESRYANILLELKQNFNETKLEIEQELIKSIEYKKELINNLIRTKDEKIEAVTRKYIDEKKLLEADAKALQQEFSRLNRKEGELKHFEFNKEEIAASEERIKKYEEELLKLTSEIKHNEIDIKEIEKEIQSVKENLSNALKQLNESYEQTKQSLFDTKQSIEKKLDFDSQNLYAYLSKNQVKNREKIVTYLKDEILFSPKNFTVKNEGEGDAIFGLEVVFEEEFSNEYKQEELLQELQQVKTEIKELNKKTQKMKHKLEDEASLQTKELNRQRSVLYKTKEDLYEKQKSYVKNRDELKITLAELIKDAQSMKREAIESLNSELIILNEKIKQNSQRVAFVTQKIEEQRTAVNLSVNEEIKKIDREIAELKEQSSQALKRLEAKFLEDENAYNAEKLAVLEEKGIDKSVLDEIRSKQKEIQSKLEAIEKNRKYVYQYIELQDELRKIPQKESALHKQEEQYKAIIEKINFVERTYATRDQNISDAIKQLSRQKENLSSFLDKYKKKIANQPIQKSIEKLLVLDYSVEVESINSNDIDDLKDIFEAIKANEAEIKALVLRSLRDLKPDNIFKIDIPTDFIEDIEYTRTAKELVEYIQKDKLTPLKDALSEQFKGEIRKITKELDIFEDALLDIYAQIKALGNTMRKAVASFNVIDSIEIKAQETNNNLLSHLKELSEFYDNNSDNFLNGLFDVSIQESKRVKKELDNRIMELVELLNNSKEYLELEDGFVLEFKIVEKGNNLKWRQNIDDIGSNGTSTLVKSIINISMLQMVSKNIVKERELLSHCVLDEIGTISTDYFKELKEFVNRSGFVFLNGMPIEDDMLIAMYPTIYIGQNHNNYSKMILASKMEM